MSQDQVEDRARVLKAQPEDPATTAQAHAPNARAAHTEPSERDAAEGKPVKAGRAILLLAVAAIAVAYTGISGRRRR